MKPAIKLGSVLFGAAAYIASTIVMAASADVDRYPTKTVRLIVPFVIGIGTDIIARQVAAKLTERWGQQVIVDNRSGAAGAIGVELAMMAPPDGYTICLISASQSVSSATNSNLRYDLTKDLQGVSQMISLNYILYVNPGVPVKTVGELVSYAKANPNKLNYGSSGVGSLQHLAAELLKHSTGIQMVHVPYKGGAEVNPAAIAGHIQVGFGTLLSRQLYAAGKLRPLGISARTRSKIAPEIPTIAEQGVPGYEVDQWYGIIASAKVPVPIVNRISRGISEVVNSPEIEEKWAADGALPVGNSPQEFSAHIKSEVAKWRKLVKDANIVLE
jgi:tripartite-type tricarboxylate transporter receptor subunit TctC